MDCADVQAELIPYHLGTLEEAAADAMDAHLLTCAACLRGYLQRKRSLELSLLPPADARPSPAARARLRAAVQATFRPRLSSRLWRLWVRPIPLYQGVFAMTVAVLLFGLLTPLLREPPGWLSDEPRTLFPAVDRARLTPPDVRTY